MNLKVRGRAAVCGVRMEALWEGRRLTRKGSSRDCDGAGRQAENPWMMEAVECDEEKEVVMRLQTIDKSDVLQCIIGTETNTPPFP